MSYCGKALHLRYLQGYGYASSQENLEVNFVAITMLGTKAIMQMKLYLVSLVLHMHSKRNYKFPEISRGRLFFLFSNLILLSFGVLKLQKVCYLIFYIAHNIIEF